MSNLTKKQKILFVILVILVILLAGSVAYLLKDNNGTKKADKSSEIQAPAVIKEMSGDEAKQELSDVYSNPELTRTYRQVKIESANSDIITIVDSNNALLEVKLTTASKIEKLYLKDGQYQTTAGDKSKLVKGIVLDFVKINPLKEIVYASYFE